MQQDTPQSSIQIYTDPLISSETLAQWAIDRLPDDELSSVDELGGYRAFGITRDKKPLAVVIWNQYRKMRFGGDMRVIIVSEDPSWCLPEVLRELFYYPFITVGCNRLTAVIRDGNHKSLRFCQGLGFKKEGTIRQAHNGKTNAIVLGMLKHECKWLNRGQTQEHEENGQEVFAGSAAAAKPDRSNKRANRGKQGRNSRVGARERGGHIQPNGLSYLQQR